MSNTISGRDDSRQVTGRTPSRLTGAGRRRHATASAACKLALALVAGLVPGLLLASCGESIVGGEVPNTPPETEVTATPPVLSETEFSVGFFWTGFDPDGGIAGYEWRISANGADGVVDVADTLEAGLPWTYTTATDSSFIVSADIPDFQKDVDDSLSEKSTRFWQTHTFFVRAVDRAGKVDPTPANVSFTATTLAPTVQINLPGKRQPGDCSLAPPAIAFGWEGVDPDNPEKDPEFVRYLLKRFGGKEDKCLLSGEFEDGAFPIVNDDPAWSDWVRYDAPQDSGKIVRYPARPAQDLGTSYVFAVQARDIAGAVTPTFEWGRNVRHVRISDTKAPQLTVTERFLGSALFQKTALVKRFTIASKQQIEFEWFADASSYGNLIDGYRYGFNLLDPDDPDDDGWVVPWGNGPNWRRAAPRTFAQGSPNFIVQARDNSNQISRATYLFQVVQVARRSEQRRLLLVDDFIKSSLVPESARLDALWDATWRDLIQGIGVKGFQSADVLDTEDEGPRLSFPVVNDYRSVIWFTGPGTTYFKERLAPANREAPRFNWLEVYQSFVGNVLFVGPFAMDNTLEDHTQPFPLVFNASGSGTLGTTRGTDGGAINVGTLRYPYTGWCLEAIDQVRPPSQQVTGERPGFKLREPLCSEIVYAGVADEFYGAFEANPSTLGALLPTDRRKFGAYKYNAVGGLDPSELNTMSLPQEEFYNANVTSRTVSLNLRNCQTPMFRAVARRDVDEFSVFSSPLAAGFDEQGLSPGPAIVDSVLVSFIDPDNYLDDCASQLGPDRRATSPISLQTIGVASTAFTGGSGRPPSKQDGTLLSADFLWGFNPIGFETSSVRTALRWVIIDHWGVNQDF